MENWLKKNQCTGCGACKNICPKGAIRMEMDSSGFMYPVIDNNLCINCGLCKKTCPILEKFEPNRFDKPNVYATWSKNEKNRYISTSGGMFFELAKYVIENDGYVIGARYDENNMVEHFLVNDIDGLELLRQSKYLQSNTKNIFNEAKDILKSGKTLLFSGTPCQIAGLLKFLKKDYDNLITVEFICRGVNSPKAYKCWLSEIEMLENSKVSKVWFKYKINGWKVSPRCTRVDLKNGKTRIYFGDNNTYMTGYLSANLYIRPSCGECHFKALPRQADITLADFWGIKKELDDDKGTSLVIINSKKGKKIFDNVKNNINFYERTFEEILGENGCFTDSVKLNPKSEKFLKKINNKNFSKLVKRYSKKSIFSSIYKKIKNNLPVGDRNEN